MGTGIGAAVGLQGRLLLWALLVGGADAGTARATVTARGAAPGGPS